MKGYQKVRKLIRCYLYLLSFAYNFCMEKKPTDVLLVVKCKSNTLIIINFIIKFKVHGMVTRRNSRLVP